MTCASVVVDIASRAAMTGSAVSGMRWPFHSLWKYPGLTDGLV